MTRGVPLGRAEPLKRQTSGSRTAGGPDVDWLCDPGSAPVKLYRPRLFVRGSHHICALSNRLFVLDI